MEYPTVRVPRELLDALREVARQQADDEKGGEHSG